MNARRSRLRRRERQKAHAAGLSGPPDVDAAEVVQRLRVVRDLRLADNGRRRREDFAQLEGYYRAERRAIWAQFHGLMQAIREGHAIEIVDEPGPEQEAPSRRKRLLSFAWLRRRRGTVVVS